MICVWRLWRARTLSFFLSYMDPEQDALAALQRSQQRYFTENEEQRGPRWAGRWIGGAGEIERPNTEKMHPTLFNQDI